MDGENSSKRICIRPFLKSPRPTRGRWGGRKKSEPVEKLGVGVDSPSITVEDWGGGKSLKKNASRNNCKN